MQNGSFESLTSIEALGQTAFPASSPIVASGASTSSLAFVRMTSCDVSRMLGPIRAK